MDGQGLLDDELAAARSADFGCRGHRRFEESMPKKGRVAVPGLVGDGARDRGDHDAAGFGLPPGIDDGAFAAADLRGTTSRLRD
jgi:hypothetical protein